MARSHHTRLAALTHPASTVPKPIISAVPFGAWPTREVTLTGPDREALRSIAIYQRLPARTLLFQQGQPATHIFNVVGGSVYVDRVLPTGSRRGLALLLPGDLCGLASRGLYVNSARTLTDADILKFPLEELRAVLLRNASLQMLFLCKAAHGIRESQRQILLLSRKDPVERLALLISTLRLAPSGAPADTLALPTSHQELASYLDLSTDQLARAVKRLAADGIVRYGRGVLTVLDPEKLQRIIEQAPGHPTDDDAPAPMAETLASASDRRRPVRARHGHR
jgi:CRP/FNR family transcriptional regulator